MKLLATYIAIALTSLSACRAGNDPELLPFPKPTPPEKEEEDKDEPTLYEGYTLVWAEEFDYNGMPDPDSWSVEVRKPGWVNNELQHYVDSPDNIAVSNGTLKLTCRKETNGNITSGRIHSGNKKIFTYGRFDIRAKLPGGKGIWPAIWMHGLNIDSVGWPTCGEIDIMEYVGYDLGRIHASIHTRDRNHAIQTQVTAQTMVPDCSDGFHVYSLEWTPKAIFMYVDDVKYFTYIPENYDVGNWPFMADEMVILNVAWGGWGAAGGGVDESVLPQTMEVDYVRVYQKEK
jgi:beta-glucanase (GH16 family)